MALSNLAEVAINAALNFAPGSDIDVDLITVAVTGTPKAWWDEAADSFKLNKNLSVAGVASILGIGDGGVTNYDLRVGTTGTPTYGMIQMGDSCIGRTSFKAGNIDLDGTIICQNKAGPITGEIEFIWTESGGGTTRFALPKSGVGLATYNPRSMLIAGPAPPNTDFVKVSYWQGQGIFDNLLCDTSGVGADLGVQNDLEIEGILYLDNIAESTPGAGLTLNSDAVFAGSVEIDAALNHDGHTVGFYGAAPTTQAAHIADADGTLADVTAKFNTLLAQVAALGLQAAA